MTLEKLLGASADELDKFTAEERKAFFAPYLSTTRPSAEHKVAAPKVAPTAASKKREALDKLEQLFLEKTGQRLKL